MRSRGPAMLVLLMLAPVGSPPARAQSLAAPELSLLLPNYERTLVGETEAIEAGAFIARADGAVATFYNPAGLGLVETSQLTAGASGHEWIRYSVSGEAATAGRRSHRSLGGIFGVALGSPPLGSDRWRVGFLVMHPVSWQPALEVQTRRPAPGGFEEITHITVNSVSDMAPTLAAAYRVNPKIRIGASAGLSMYGIYQNRSSFSDLATASGIRSTEATIFSDGSTYSLMLAGGVQWDAAPRVRVGAAVTAPGIRLGGSSSIIYRGALSEGSSSVVANFSDDSAMFQYKQPLKVSAGVAWRHERGEIEFDLRYHVSPGTYAVYSSDQDASVVIAADGVTTEAVLPFPDQTYTASHVANVALGGNFKVADSVTVHGGLFTDRSPVADGPQPVFFRLSLVGATAGASLRFRGLSGSVGISYLTGQSVMTLRTQEGGVVTPEIRVNSIGMTYALSYTF